MCVLAVGAEARPFTVHDLVAMQRIGDPQVSPDGSQVAFVVTTMDLEANRGRSDLWIAAVDGTGARQLTTHTAGDWNPRWISDSELVFLSSRSETSQVWTISLEGGEARQVTDLPLDVEAVMVGASAQLFVAMRVLPECERDLQCSVEKIKAEEERKTSGQIYDELFVRHWDRWIDHRRNHIFRLQPAGDDGLVREAKDLMPGVDGDCPTVPWGGPDDVTFSPDGRWAVYTAKVVEGSEEAWSTNWDLWAVPTDGSESPRCLTSDNPAWDTAPQFSPDGTTLAYLAMERAGYESDRRRVMLRPWPDGEAKAIAPEWDRSPGGLTWTRDGAALLATADNVGHHSLFRIDAATGAVSALVTERTNRSPNALPDGSVLFAQDSLVSPVELKVVGANGGELRQVTDLNRERLAGLELGAYEQFEFTGAHGDTVYGFLIKPVGFDPDQSYPLAFLVHGGPQGSFGDHWHYRWNPEIYAAHGYATVMIDFHGSTGYGQAFTDSIRGDWGGAPFEDLMKGLDWVLAHAPWIDSERMAALGASYGGYMINWIQGNTDRFAALVCHDGNLDEFMAYFDTEELWFPEWEHGGTPWENPEGYRKHSPVSKLANWSTPELVIHGQKDYRVVVTQGLGTFNALQRLGVPSRLLYFPDENHWVLKPLNSIQWHEVVLDWIDRWTANE